jgi:hypothetical protein
MWHFQACTVADLRDLPGLDPDGDGEYFLKGLKQDSYWDFARCLLFHIAAESTHIVLMGVYLMFVVE